MMVDSPSLLCRDGALLTLKNLLICRSVEEKMQKLVRQNKGGTFHLSVLGHELIGVVSALAMKPGCDWALPYYRDRCFALAWGCGLKDLFATLLARESPHHSGGRMMPDHFVHKGLRIPCQSSVVGSQLLQAVGVAQAIRFAGKDEVVYVSIGDGGTSQGDFHEALNYACLYRLPVLFVVQDNDWAISVPASEQTAGGSIAKRAQGYSGLRIFECDGCDFAQAAQVLEEAVGYARQGEGPSLVVAKVPRIGAHSSSDDPKKYKSEETIAQEAERDPLPRMQRYVLDQGWITEGDLLKMQQEAHELVESAAREADALPFPDAATASTKVFKEADPIELKPEPPLSSAQGVVMVDALNHALDEEMERSEKVVVFGQDVAHGKGGVFGVTRGLTEKYGVRRCFNTPLAESTIVGLAIGMSMAYDFVPVVEIQFADYIWTGINQIFNELASIYYRSNGVFNAPVVIRAPCGGYIQGGPYHSQSIEGFLAHCPGLKVVFPSNASDAKRLLKASIRDPNPVIFLEHKALYRQRVFCAREEPGASELLPLGKAHVVCSGTDVTLVAWGMTVVMGYEVAQKLAKEGISVELIDLRTIVPFDRKTVMDSVKKTGKAVIAHEASLFCGFGAEVAAQLAEECFSHLDAPIRRIGAGANAVPYCKVLEDAHLPQVEEIERALRALAAF